MAEAPAPSDISNVFGMNEPQHMLTKMYVELNDLQNSLSIWDKNEPYPKPLFIAYNVAVTAWHMTDWLWMSSLETRALLAKLYDIHYFETPTGIGSGLARFQDKVADACRPLYICREIANGSKHLRRKKSDPKIQALIDWQPAPADIGEAKAGDMVMNLVIVDDGKKRTHS
jgi:hypothetical protein